MPMKVIFLAVFMFAQCACAIQSIDIKLSEAKHRRAEKVSVEMNSGGGVAKASENSLAGLHKRAVRESKSAATDDVDTELDTSLQAKEGMVKQTELEKCIEAVTSFNDGLEMTQLEVVNCDPTQAGTSAMTFKLSHHQIRLKNADLCLTGEVSPTNHNKGFVYGRTCVSTDDPRYDYQKWAVQHDAHEVKLHGTSLCMKAGAGQSVVSLKSCDSDSDHQKFQIVDIPTTAATDESLLLRRSQAKRNKGDTASDSVDSSAQTKEGMIKQTEITKCLEAVTTAVEGSEQTQLEIVNCDAVKSGTSNMIFKQSGANTGAQIHLKSRDTCLAGEVSETSNSKGQVVGRTCVHSTHPAYSYQQWEVDADNKELKLKGTTLCMEARPGQSALSLHTCNSGSNHQKFQIVTDDDEDAS